MRPVFILALAAAFLSPAVLAQSSDTSADGNSRAAAPEVKVQTTNTRGRTTAGVDPCAPAAGKKAKAVAPVTVSDASDNRAAEKVEVVASTRGRTATAPEVECEPEPKKKKKKKKE
jgi:hypothetical protein